MAGYKRDKATDAFIRSRGGVITETSDGRLVDFPDREREPVEEERPFGGNLAEQIEKAVERAVASGMVERVRWLWRPLGDGWFTAPSEDEHPGLDYLGQIDPLTGQPVKCECVATVVCDHLGAAIYCWRERVGWYESAAAIQAEWDALRAGFPHPERRKEEEW